MKRWIARLLVLATLLLPQTVVFAQQSTLLPETTDCNSIEFSFQTDSENIYIQTWDELTPESKDCVLALAIKYGKIHLWMIPYYITYFANFFIGLSGVISVLFVLLGGFWYMTGGLTDDKEKGKKTITYALGGMVLTLLAWLIVNIIQVQVTR